VILNRILRIESIRISLQTHWGLGNQSGPPGQHCVSYQRPQCKAERISDRDLEMQRALRHAEPARRDPYGPRPLYTTLGTTILQPQGALFPDMRHAFACKSLKPCRVRQRLATCSGRPLMLAGGSHSTLFTALVLAETATPSRGLYKANPFAHRMPVPSCGFCAADTARQCIPQRDPPFRRVSV